MTVPTIINASHGDIILVTETGDELVQLKRQSELIYQCLDSDMAEMSRNKKRKLGNVGLNKRERFPKGSK